MNKKVKDKDYALIGAENVSIERFGFAFTANAKQQTAGCCLS